MNRWLVLASLFFGLTDFALQSKGYEVFLKPPGLRPLKDPAGVVPAWYKYPNQQFELPSYRTPSGPPSKEWAVRTVKTRRFSSNRSARLYYRTSDLARSTVFQEHMRIWPHGAIIVLEVYPGNQSMEKNSRPVEILAIAKTDQSASAPKGFHPQNWSYAKFTRQGFPVIRAVEVLDCHQCHSIAFHLTGDLVFTQFNS